MPLIFFIANYDHLQTSVSLTNHNLWFVALAQAGPRVCLGKEFAYRQMKVFAAVLLYLFRFEMWDANATIGYRAMLTLKMDRPLYVRASLRR